MVRSIHRSCFSPIEPSAMPRLLVVFIAIPRTPGAIGKVYQVGPSGSAKPCPTGPGPRAPGSKCRRTNSRAVYGRRRASGVTGNDGPVTRSWDSSGPSAAGFDAIASAICETAGSVPGRSNLTADVYIPSRIPFGTVPRNWSSWLPKTAYQGVVSPGLRCVRIAARRKPGICSKPRSL